MNAFFFPGRVAVCSLLLLFALAGCGKPDIFSILKSGDLDGLKKLIESDPSPAVGARNEIGQTSLHIAVLSGDLEAVSLLLKAGASPLVRDDLGLVPSAYARSLGFDEIERLLVEHGGLYEAARSGDPERLRQQLARTSSSIDEPDDRGRPPLDYAIRSGRKECVQFLIEQGADIRYRLPDGSTSLHTAVRYGQKEILRLLIERGVHPEQEDRRGRTPLQLAEELSQDEAAEILKEEADLPTAVLRGDVKKVQEILDRAPDLVHQRDDTGATPLYRAVEKNDPEMVRVLVSHGARNEPGPGGRPPLVRAALTNSYEVLRELLAAGFPPDEKDGMGRTALYYAVRNGNSEAAELLIEHGADLHSRFENGLTLLEIAAMKGSREVVDLLIRKGAEVQAESAKARTALYWAVKHDHRSVIDLLKVHGAHLGQGTETPFHTAVREGDLQKVTSLLKNDPTGIHARDGLGRTPLHVAAESGNREIVQLLLEAGADSQARDDMGKTPLYWARFYGHTQIIPLLTGK